MKQMKQSIHSPSPWRTMLIVCVALASTLSIITAAAASAPATISVAADANGQQTITVAGAGESVTLAQVGAGLGTFAPLLEDQGNGTWQLNANLVVERATTLTLSPATGVAALHLRSQPSAAPPAPGAYDYASFVYLRTNDGTIVVDGAAISSWDPQANAVDTDVANGRAYILAKYAARLDIHNAELSYLGSADGESYGVSWRDTNDPAVPTTLRTRVTGEVTNSTFHHNYYGIYTFQAAGMVFRSNAFYRNVRYGFDPHDFSHDFLIEDNQSFENGSHGFIISRGCTGFIFRRNASYANSDPNPASLAHGFMLDPGAPDSADPQASSSGNLLEANHAYDNEGYGLRILGSTNNLAQNNLFERNQQGITVEQGSGGNTLRGNTVSASRLHGIFVRGGANNTSIVSNTISASGGNGLYIKSDANSVVDNNISASQGFGIALMPETTVAAAAADLRGRAAPAQATPVAPELVGRVVAEPTLDNNTFVGNRVATSIDNGINLKRVLNSRLESNLIERNGGYGVYLADGTRENRLLRNTLTANGSDGLRANGADVTQNSWSENRIFNNATSDIRLTGGANESVAAPTNVRVQGSEVSGLATPGALVEIFSGTGLQGRTFEGRTTAGADGRFTLPIAHVVPSVVATATDAAGNSSAFSDSPTNILYLPIVAR